MVIWLGTPSKGHLYCYIPSFFEKLDLQKHISNSAACCLRHCRSPVSCAVGRTSWLGYWPPSVQVAEEITASGYTSLCFKLLTHWPSFFLKHSLTCFCPGWENKDFLLKLLKLSWLVLMETCWEVIKQAAWSQW